jgi:hypothetical protein
MNQKNTGEWILDSGIWLTANIASGLRLTQTKAGNAVSPHLQADDLRILMQTRDTSPGAAQFPPEFRYNPIDGSALASPRPGHAAPWIPPFGSRPLARAQNSAAAGLRNASVPLTLFNKAGRNEESQEDATLPVPPPGDYHFFSSTFGTVENALLAIDAGKGSLFGWLPASKKWQALQSSNGQLLSECQLPREAWRGEMACGFHSRLYLPTAAGLACVTPDLPALRYHISHIGKGAVVGAPIVFNQQIWAPLRQADGGIQLVSVNADGNAGATLAVPAALAQGKLDGVSLPVAYDRQAVWPAEHGQLHLQLQADGSVVAQFLPWPDGIAPQFQFGSPYQSSSGALWQLCFDNQHDHYLYLELGKAAPERVRADSPRFCSGSVNYRFDVKLKNQPWQEPDSGDDGAANAVVIPLLEVGQGGIIGLRLANSQSLAALLASPERTRLQLVWDDDNSETVFHTNVVDRPWRMRLFTHDDHLWAYHPEFPRAIYGWKLA